MAGEAYRPSRMRLLLGLLGFLALLTAPLAAPAGAALAGSAAEHCAATMAEGHEERGAEPAAADNSCCMAVAAALPLAAAVEARPSSPLRAAARPCPGFPLSLGEVEIPPPRG
jgi:hypothetical protein